jgi:hypothetical protein
MSRSPSWRDWLAGRERLRRGAVRDHGPVGIAVVPAGSRVAAGLPLAGDLPDPLRPRPGRSRPLLIDTRARHELTAGEYGRRRTEYERAARLLGIHSLRYLTDDDQTGRLSDPVLRRRARHVVSDNARVLSVVALLRSASAAAYPEIGALLTQAHASLRDDFEVSWPEADVAVDAALAAGALGARMMGGGFGGSVLALVPEGRPGTRCARRWPARSPGGRGPSGIPGGRSFGQCQAPGFTVGWPSTEGGTGCRYVTRRRRSRATSPN